MVNREINQLFVWLVSNAGARGRRLGGTAHQPDIAIDIKLLVGYVAI
jgi:hypothetical protein